MGLASLREKNKNYWAKGGAEAWVSELLRALQPFALWLGFVTEVSNFGAVHRVWQ